MFQCCLSWHYKHCKERVFDVSNVSKTLQKYSLILFSWQRIRHSTLKTWRWSSVSSANVAPEILLLCGLLVLVYCFRCLKLGIKCYTVDRNRLRLESELKHRNLLSLLFQDLDALKDATYVCRYVAPWFYIKIGRYIQLHVNNSLNCNFIQHLYCLYFDLKCNSGK